MSAVPLVQVRGLVKHFPIRRGLLRLGRPEMVHAVNGIDFDIGAGETLGLVGESGCGKSTTARLLVRLLEPTSGSVIMEGVDLADLDAGDLRAVRRNFQIVFQDPVGSLDPRMKVRDIIGEPLRVASTAGRGERHARVSELLRLVGLPENAADRYPHEFSGGQRQRIGIARALALSPRLVVCDEPVSALDVSIQAQIVNLLKDLQRDLGLTYVFVSHDLSIVSQIADRVAVMYLGRIVEIAPTRALFAGPMHPYTRALLDAVPVPDPARRRRRTPLGGELPSPLALPRGCHFHPRCPLAVETCRQTAPELRGLRPGHAVACHLANPDQETAT